MNIEDLTTGTRMKVECRDRFSRATEQIFSSQVHDGQTKATGTNERRFAK